MRVPFVDLKAQLADVRDDVFRNLAAAIDDTAFILGDEVREFEEAFAGYCGVRYAIGVNSGLDALRLALMAMGVEAGDEIIVPANTFIACALAITDLGARPILVEPDEATYVLDVERVERAITPRTKAIMPVHLYGQPVDMTALSAIAERRGLRLIEDCSQAHGARDQGRRVGGLGSIAAFSLYPGKNLGAYGDGGIVTTDDQTWAERIRLLRNYGSSRKYYHEICGFNTRLDTLQAAVLTAKLPRLDGWNGRRRAAAIRYSELLRGVGDVITPTVRTNVEHVFHLYVIRSRYRDQIAENLERRGVATIIHYPIPIHLQKAYRQTGWWKGGEFPLTERLCSEILSLPMFPEITSEQIKYVAEAIQSFFKELPNEQT